MPFHRMIRHSLPLLLGSALALSGCGEEDTFELEHDGASVAFEVGQQFFVHLPLDVEAGHHWDIESVKVSVVKAVDATVEEGEEEGDQTINFTFECAGAGNTQLLIVESDALGALAGKFELEVTCEASADEELEREREPA